MGGTNRLCISVHDWITKRLELDYLVLWPKHFGVVKLSTILYYSTTTRKNVLKRKNVSKKWFYMCGGIKWFTFPFRLKKKSFFPHLLFSLYYSNITCYYKCTRRSKRCRVVTSTDSFFWARAHRAYFCPFLLMVHNLNKLCFMLVVRGYNIRPLCQTSSISYWLRTETYVVKTWV